MSETTQAIGAIVAAIIGLAIVAVLVSKNAQTASVIQAGGSALGTVIGQAVSPVTGTGGSTNTGSLLPNLSSGFGGFGGGGLPGLSMI